MSKLPKGLVTTDKKGRVLPDQFNALSIMAHDPELVGILRHNAFSGLDMLERQMPLNGIAPQPGAYPRPVTDQDITLLHGYINHEYNPKFSALIVRRAAEAAATSASFHPVVEWLSGLVWDGKPRLDNWLVNVFNPPADTNEQKALIAAFGSKFLIAAVRRVMDPGCKFDCMLVLEGAQGIGKSTCCRVLFGNEWFSDDLPHNFANKDAAMQLQGVWGIEMAELAQLTSRRSGIETIKSFLSRQVDRYRPAYGHKVVSQPRQMVFVGTTNQTDWAPDDSAGNRRFWPVFCRSADYEWVRVNRDQLWAEVVLREANGETIHLDHDDLVLEASHEGEKRREPDPWTQKVEAELTGRNEISTSKVFEILDIPSLHQTRSLQMRAARLLQNLGWKKHLEYNQKTKKMNRIWKLP